MFGPAVNIATPWLGGPLLTLLQQPTTPREHPGSVFKSDFFTEASRQFHAAAIRFDDGRRFMNPFNIHGARQQFMNGLANRDAVIDYLRKLDSSLRPINVGLGRTAMSLVYSDFTGNSLLQDPLNPTAPVNPYTTNYTEATVFVYVDAPEDSPSQMPHMCPIKLYVQDQHIEHLAQVAGREMGGLPKVPGFVHLWQTDSPIEERPSLKPAQKSYLGIKTTIRDQFKTLAWATFVQTKRRPHLPFPTVPISIAVATPPGMIGGTFGLLSGAKIYAFNKKKDHLTFPWGDKRGLDFTPLTTLICSSAQLVVGAGDVVVSEHPGYTRLYEP